jgi:hypothetical protein
MPNGGLHHCGHCVHYKNGLCELRNELIKIPYWTTCQNWNSQGIKPKGVIYAIVAEVKNGSISYGEIPYYNGVRVDAIQKGSSDTEIVCYYKDGDILKFKDAREYLEFYSLQLSKKKKYIMGAVIGDIIGSVYEFRNIKTTDFHLFSPKTTFTDDTVLTFATMYIHRSMLTPFRVKITAKNR